jgi:hypothetical protein
MRCVRRLASQSDFDPRSFRWKTSGRGMVLVACPKGSFRRNQCRVGMRAYEVVTERTKRCKRGERRK